MEISIQDLTAGYGANKQIKSRKLIEETYKHCKDIIKITSSVKGPGVCIPIVTLGRTSPWLSRFFLTTTLRAFLSVICFVESHLV
jgi:hypothetical protein